MMNESETLQILSFFEGKPEELDAELLDWLGAAYAFSAAKG